MSDDQKNYNNIFDHTHRGRQKQEYPTPGICRLDREKRKRNGGKECGIGSGSEALALLTGAS